MQISTGSFIIPYQDEVHGTLGMRIAWDGAIDRRKLKRMVVTNFKRYTGRQLNPDQLKYFMENLINVE